MHLWWVVRSPPSALISLLGCASWWPDHRTAMQETPALRSGISDWKQFEGKKDGCMQKTGISSFMKLLFSISSRGMTGMLQRCFVNYQTSLLSQLARSEIWLSPMLENIIAMKQVVSARMVDALMNCSICIADFYINWCTTTILKTIVDASNELRVTVSSCATTGSDVKYWFIISHSFYDWGIACFISRTKWSMLHIAVPEV